MTSIGTYADIHEENDLNLLKYSMTANVDTTNIHFIS